MDLRTGLWAAALGLAAAIAAGPAGAGAPKRGGTLTYVIPADAPPSFDAHRETTYATIHAAAPYYSVLIRRTIPPRPRSSCATSAPKCPNRRMTARHTPSRSARA
jgi:hypothetical protein